MKKNHNKGENMDGEWRNLLEKNRNILGMFGSKTSPQRQIFFIF